MFEDEVVEPEIAPLHAISLTSCFFKFYKSQIATDITINCESEVFNLHTPVLIHGSGYFKRALEDEDADLNLEFSPSIEPETFRIISESMYTGVVRGMNDENVTSILEASFHLDVKSASEACVDYMRKNIDLDNCLQYWLTAKLSQNKAVKNIAIGLIGRHLEEVSTGDNFLGLQSETVLEIISDDFLKVPTEKLVYEAVMNWIKFDEEGKRDKHLGKLLAGVRLAHLPVLFLVNVVGKEDLIEEDSKAMSLYSKALKAKLGKVQVVTKKRHHALNYVHGYIEKAKKNSDGNLFSNCKKPADEKEDVEPMGEEEVVEYLEIEQINDAHDSEDIEASHLISFSDSHNAEISDGDLSHA